MIIQKREPQRQHIIESQKYICIGSKHKGDYVAKTEIVYIEAYESYSWIYLMGGCRMLSSKTIGYHQKSFTEDNFTRIHRSYLINLTYLKLYEPRYRLVHLKGEIVLPVSHRKNRLISKIASNPKSNTPFRIAV